MEQQQKMYFDFQSPNVQPNTLPESRSHGNNTIKDIYTQTYGPDKTVDSLLNSEVFTDKMNTIKRVNPSLTSTLESPLPPTLLDPIRDRLRKSKDNIDLVHNFVIELIHAQTINESKQGVAIDYYYRVDANAVTSQLNKLSPNKMNDDDTIEAVIRVAQINEILDTGSISKNHVYAYEYICQQTQLSPMDELGQLCDFVEQQCLRLQKEISMNHLNSSIQLMLDRVDQLRKDMKTISPEINLIGAKRTRDDFGGDELHRFEEVKRKNSEQVKTVVITRLLFVGIRETIIDTICKCYTDICGAMRANNLTIIDILQNERLRAPYIKYVSETLTLEKYAKLKTQIPYQKQCLARLEELYAMFERMKK